MEWQYKTFLTGYDSGFNHICRVNDDTYFIVGAHLITSSPYLIAAKLFRTLNGGIDWAEIPVPTMNQDENTIVISFVSSSIGYIAYSGSSGPTAYHRIFKTVNAGVNWSSVSYPVNPSDPQTTIKSICFKDENNGLMGVFSNGGYYLYITDDSGATWTSPFSNYRNHSEWIRKIIYAGNDTYFMTIFGTDAIKFIYKIVGVTFSQCDQIFTAGHYNDISAVSENVIWFVYVDGSLNGHIAISINGGSTWSDLQIEFEPSGVKAFSSSIAIITGYDKKCYLTADGGQSFTDLGAELVYSSGWHNVDGKSIYELIINGVGEYGDEIAVGTPSTITITLTQGEHGKIIALDGLSIVQGNRAAFLLIPDPGYEVEDVLIDSVSEGAVMFYAFENISANHTIAATFIRSESMNSDKANMSKGGMDVFYYDHALAELYCAGTLRESSLKGGASPLAEPDQHGRPVQLGVDIKHEAEMLETIYTNLQDVDSVVNKNVHLWLVNAEETHIIRWVDTLVGYDGSHHRKKANAAKLVYQKSADTVTSGIWMLRGWYDPTNLLMLIAPELQKNSGTDVIVDAGNLDLTPVKHGNASSLWSNDGKSLIFNGTDQYLSISDAQLTGKEIINNADATIAIWFKKAAAAGADATFFTAQNKCIRFYTDDNDTQKVYVIIDDGSSTVTLTGDADVIDNAWHCAVVTIDNGGNAKLYIDNVLNDTQDVSGLGALEDDLNGITLGGDGTTFAAIQIGPAMVKYAELWTADDVAKFYNSTVGKYS